MLYWTLFHIYIFYHDKSFTLITLVQGKYKLPLSRTGQLRKLAVQQIRRPWLTNSMTNIINSKACQKVIHNIKGEIQISSLFKHLAFYIIIMIIDNNGHIFLRVQWLYWHRRRPGSTAPSGLEKQYKESDYFRYIPISLLSARDPNECAYW